MFFLSACTEERPCENAEKKQLVAVCKRGRVRDLTKNQPCWHLGLGLPASRTVRNKRLLLKSPSLWDFLWQPEHTTMPVKAFRLSPG